MIKKVYVPLDGTEVADGAIRPASELAIRAGAPVVLLAAPWPGAGESTVRGYLDAQVAFLDGPVETWVMSAEDPVAAIVQAVDEPGALVCMATRGRGAVRATLLGSVAEAVVRSARGPVVLVGPKVDSGWALPERPSILVGIDGSEPSRVAAHAAASVARGIGAGVDLGEVVTPLDDGGERELAELGELATALRSRGVDAHAVPLDGFDAATVLVHEARHRGCALVGVGSHGRSGVSRVVLGSVASAVVRTAPMPVIVAGPNASDER